MLFAMDTTDWIVLSIFPLPILFFYYFVFVALAFLCDVSFARICHQALRYSVNSCLGSKYCGGITFGGLCNIILLNLLVIFVESVPCVAYLTPAA